MRKALDRGPSAAHHRGLFCATHSGCSLSPLRPPATDATRNSTAARPSSVPSFLTILTIALFSTIYTLNQGQMRNPASRLAVQRLVLRHPRFVECPTALPKSMYNPESNEHSLCSSPKRICSLRALESDVPTVSCSHISTSGTIG